MHSIALQLPPSAAPRPGSRDSLLRRLALLKLREMRRRGLRIREIVARFAPPGARPRLTPERLLRPDRSVTHLEAWREQTTLLVALDTLEQGVALFSFTGRLLHLNLALAGTLSRSGDGGRLRQEVEHFGDSLSSLVHLRALGPEDVVEDLGSRRVEVAGVEHCMRGSYLGLDLFGTGSTLFVSWERPGPEPLSPERLQERFGLTPQECRVAALLAEGHSNARLAGLLRISPHTARHHTEHVLRKLEVRSRAEVAARLLRP